MIQYILECIAFQLVFLIIYDFFLKRETFFQWNRLYLISTYVLSMVLPWVKIEALKTTVPEQYYAYPEFLWNTDSISATVTSSEAPRFHLSWDQGILSGGMLLAAVYFGYKLYQIYKLRNAGAIQRFPNFTQIVVKNSELAFSFFKSIFLGDKVVQREYQSIIQHELVHIEQRHSWDLLFFELMRIVGWFNPLVYVYQNRVSELHEFIADSKVAKTDKKGQYEFLLSQIFQTENISFVNQFFKSSLIRKRIAMLQRKQSKKVWQLKYLLLVPLLLGMLLYTSSEAQESESIQQKQTSDDADLIDKLNAKIDIEIEKSGSLNKVFHKFRKEHDFFGFDYIMSKDEYFENTLLFQRHSANFSDSLKKAETPFFRGFRKQPLPSTTRYKSYVVRTEAFLILDDNLRVSISTNRNNEGLGARPVELKNTKTEGYLIFEVENIKDLTGDEVRAFNNKLDAVFNQNHSEYSGMVLKDGHYAFEIFETEPFNKLIEIQNDSKLFSEKPTTIDRYNQLVAERKRLLKSSNENNPVIVNLDQQIAGLRKTVFGDGETIPFAVVEEVPVFPGCEDEKDKRACFQKSMQRHISKNFRYPQEAQEKGIQGRVSIMFTISETGEINNIKMRGPHQLLEDEAERIIAILPEMKPGKDKGEPVNVPFSIPMTFKLQGDKNESLKSLNLDTLMEISPLYIIDGEESTKEEMSFINPKDIESINVLKGEAAISVYGEKGKNGVVLVTTKKNQNDTEESNEVYKADTNTMSVTATAKDKNGIKIITGTVTDGMMGLPGATIGIEGSERGVISDFDGKFEIKAKKGDLIIFQYIGLPILKFTVTDDENYQVTKKK